MFFIVLSKTSTYFIKSLKILKEIFQTLIAFNLLFKIVRIKIANSSLTFNLNTFIYTEVIITIYCKQFLYFNQN